MEVLEAFISNTNNDDNDEYLSADSSVEDDKTSSAVYDDHEELAEGVYFSLPDITLDMDFSHQLTEPLFPPMFELDFLRYYSLDLPTMSGLILSPKHTTEKPQIEYVPLPRSRSNAVPDFAFLEDLKLHVLQSCNGLLLSFSQKSKSYYVCNLATQQLDELPRFPTMGNESVLNLAFDPNMSPDYNVISVQKIDPKKPLHQITIYSSGTRLLTVSGNPSGLSKRNPSFNADEIQLTDISAGKPFEAPGDIDFNEGVFCNGAIHWMKRTPKGLYFNVNTELLREMPKPPLNNAHPLVSCEYFGESQGRLHYAISSPELPYFDIFEMKDDYTGWFLKTQINLQTLAVNFPVIGRRSNNPHPVFGRYEADILSLVQHQEDEDFEVILSVPGEVIAYNNVKKSATKLCGLRLRADDRAVWYRIYSSYQVL